MAATEFIPDQHATEAVEAHVLWMTTGLSCDGDSVAMTSAVNPSLEDIITQSIPGMPKVIVHNPVLAYENGGEFIEWWFRAERGELDPFVLCVEGSIPNENLAGEGHFAAIGNDPVDGPADHDERVARPARAEGGGRRRDRHLRHLRRHPGDEEQPHGCDGGRRPSGLELEVGGGAAGRQHPGLPGAARQHDGGAALPGAAPGGPRPGPGAGRGAAAEVVVRADRARGLQPRRLHRAGQLRDRIRRRPALPGQARLQGPGGQVQRAGPRLGRRLRRLPERGRHLHGLHDAGLPRQVHALHGRGPVRQGGGALRLLHLRPGSQVLPRAQHQEEVRPRARMAQAGEHAALGLPIRGRRATRRRGPDRPGARSSAGTTGFRARREQRWHPQRHPGPTRT